jgi:glyoxylase-like metal-dependent hydrolase (beta-lactamase superfamily II)
VAYEQGGDSWFGFSAIRALPGISADVLLIPLTGHTLGHTGVAVRQGEKWLLHCGDAFFSQRSLENPPRTPWGLSYFERAVQLDQKARLENLARLRQLAAEQAGTVEVFCSHDAGAYERLRRASPSLSRGI